MLKKQSAFKRDWARYRPYGVKALLEPSLWVIVVYRLGQSVNRCNVFLLKDVLKLIHLAFFSFFTLLTGIYIPRNCQIGGGLKIWHFGCIFLHPKVVIGEDCTLRQEVTIGNRSSSDDVPQLGDRVDVGAGAKIIGAIYIGNDVVIGANAVVLEDVPDGHIAVGVPAMVKKRRDLGD